MSEVVDIEQVGSLAMALPEVSEGEQYRTVCWFVGRKAFAWLRPFTKADLRRFGDDPVPSGPILAVRVAHGEKELVLAEHADDGFFTIAHFDGFDAVLIALDRTSEAAVREALLDGWLACAPRVLADRYFPVP